MYSDVASIEITGVKIFPYTRRMVLMACDSMAAACAIMLLSINLRIGFDGHPLHEKVQIVGFYALIIGVALAYFAYRGHYSWRTPWWQQVRQVVAFCGCAGMISALLNYIAAPTLPSQSALTLTWTLTIPFVLLARLGGRALLKKVGHWSIATIVMGDAKNVVDTLYALRAEFYLTYDIKYVVLTQADAENIALLSSEHPDIEIRAVQGIIPSHSMVILCPGANDQEITRNMIPLITATGAKLAIAPPRNVLSCSGMQSQQFFGDNVVLLESRANLQTSIDALIKGALDRVMAAAGLLLLAPVFAVLIYSVRKDGGPAFYNQLRIGKNGRMFKCWKFRSMVVNADKVLQDILENDENARVEWSRDFKLKNDPRITKIGDFLRKSSMDEIPQLYNVLRGDMSMVGPRPIVNAERAYYGENLKDYLSIRPGITGLWQISGRNDVSYEQRVALDCWYAQNWSLWNDIVIIFKTTFVVLKRKGAY